MQSLLQIVSPLCLRMLTLCALYLQILVLCIYVWVLDVSNGTQQMGILHACQRNRLVYKPSSPADEILGQTLFDSSDLQANL